MTVRNKRAIHELTMLAHGVASILILEQDEAKRGVLEEHFEQVKEEALNLGLRNTDAATGLLASLAGLVRRNRDESLFTEAVGQAYAMSGRRLDSSAAYRSVQADARRLK